MILQHISLFSSSRSFNNSFSLPAKPLEQKGKWWYTEENEVDSGELVQSRLRGSCYRFDPPT